MSDSLFEMHCDVAADPDRPFPAPLTQDEANESAALWCVLLIIALALVATGVFLCAQAAS